jgi:hypothetical protein
MRTCPPVGSQIHSYSAKHYNQRGTVLAIENGGKVQVRFISGEIASILWADVAILIEGKEQSR